MYDGTLTDSDIMISNIEVDNAPEFNYITHQLCDLSNIQSSKVSNAAIKTIATIDSQMSTNRPQMKVAIIANTAISFSISNMYQIMAERSKWETKIFDTRTTALAWLKHN